MLPNVADFVEQCDGIFVHIQRWRVDGKPESGQIERIRRETGRVPNTDIVAALVRLLQKG